MAHIDIVYDKDARVQSRVCPDFERIVNVDEDGVEKISWQLVDYRKIQDSLGVFDNWSLRSLVDAGIDPRFGIRTGFNTRLEGDSVVASAVASINEIVDSENKGA